MSGSAPWQGSDRRQRLPPDWAKRRAAVLRRDGNRCTWTLRSGRRCTHPATDVDHIVAGDDHSLENLRSLCEQHHDRKTAGEGNAARHRASRKRDPEPHPGLGRPPQETS